LIPSVNTAFRTMASAPTATRLRGSRAARPKNGRVRSISFTRRLEWARPVLCPWPA
jgi:hypothetical protein